MFKKILLILITFLLLGCASVPPKPNDSGYLLMYNGYPYPGNMIFEYRTTVLFTLPNQNAQKAVYFPADKLDQVCPNNQECDINIFMDFQHRPLGGFAVNTVTHKVTSTFSDDPNMQFYNLYYLCYYSDNAPCTDMRKKKTQP